MQQAFSNVDYLSMCIVTIEKTHVRDVCVTLVLRGRRFRKVVDMHGFYVNHPITTSIMSPATFILSDTVLRGHKRGC